VKKTKINFLPIPDIVLHKFIGDSLIVEYVLLGPTFCLASILCYFLWFYRTILSLLFYFISTVHNMAWYFLISGCFLKKYFFCSYCVNCRLIEFYLLQLILPYRRYEADQVSSLSWLLLFLIQVFHFYSVRYRKSFRNKVSHSWIDKMGSTENV